VKKKDQVTKERSLSTVALQLHSLELQKKHGYCRQEGISTGDTGTTASQEILLEVNAPRYEVCKDSNRGAPRTPGTRSQEGGGGVSKEKQLMAYKPGDHSARIGLAPGKRTILEYSSQDLEETKKKKMKQRSGY